MDVLNGSMFLNHFAILEWLQQLGLNNHVIYSNIVTSGWGSTVPSYPDYMPRSLDNPFTLRNVARRAHDDLLQANCLEWFQTLL